MRQAFAILMALLLAAQTVLAAAPCTIMCLCTAADTATADCTPVEASCCGSRPVREEAPIAPQCPDECPSCVSLPAPLASLQIEAKRADLHLPLMLALLDADVWSIRPIVKATIVEAGVGPPERLRCPDSRAISSVRLII